MKRILFSIKQAYKEREFLAAFLKKDPERVCGHITDITIQKLNDWSIKALILDFDGVLAAHGALIPNAEALDWLTKIYHAWPHPIYIFSNKPFIERENFFKAHFPKLIFLKNVAQKPYPEGLLRIQQQTNIPAQNILMVDDRLLTGILAALLGKTRALLICKPYQNFKQNFIKECWFAILRKVDKFFIYIA